MDLSFLFLYAVFGGAILLGRAVRRRPPIVGALAKAAVVALLGFLGAELSRVPRGVLLGELPLSFVFAAALLGLTSLLVLILRRPARTPPVESVAAGGSPVLTLLGYLTAFLVGLEFGAQSNLPYSLGASISLYALLALVGFDLKIAPVRWPELWVPLVGAVSAALIVSVVLSPFSPAGLRGSLATCLAFGWYSLAGQLVTNQAGASTGMLAFTTNFLREGLTIGSAPWAGRRLRGAGLAALGGATSMDTTLFSIVRYGDSGAGTLGVAVGLVLTVTAGILIPAILALPLA